MIGSSAYCDPCKSGGECKWPYQAEDGTTYTCFSFDRPDEVSS